MYMNQAEINGVVKKAVSQDFHDYFMNPSKILAPSTLRYVAQYSDIKVRFVEGLLCEKGIIKKSRDNASLTQPKTDK